ncbi:MAG TPA: sugar phosphate isomerase/epimerase family protein [Phototrophicaceae bacterium]|nr:sugar phosphate isomerase/epimerase family protein [Phototrophicaceae bacterium]
MKIGMHNWMRPEPIEVTLKRLHDFGYDGIEIMGEPRKYNVDELRRLLDKYNLVCYGSVSIMVKGRDLIHADPYFREMSIQYVKECLDLVGALGGTLYTLVPSEVGKIIAMADPETEWQWAVDGIRQIADHAGKYNIRIGLEPLNRFETNFLSRHDQALCLADDVKMENVGVCLDAFHINIEEADPYQAILNTGKRLVDFHVADNNRFPPGQGSIDWKKMIATLKQAGYDGWITSEFVVPLDRSPLAKKDEDAGTTATEAELKFIRDHGSDLMSDAAYSAHVENTIKHLRASGA